MRKLLIGIGTLLLWLSCLAHGQRMTEMYIPIGQSPGISGKTSLIGEITAVDRQRKTLTVSGPAGAQPVVYNDRTWIWLDRSQVRGSNRPGALAHLQTGRKVEIQFREADRKRPAEWIKVQVSE
jgi:hypothetical protein